MTYDDYQQMRSMYADVDELCREVEQTDNAAASDESLCRLVRLFHDQQREPEQVRSFLRHLGVANEAIGSVLGDAPPDEEEISGII